jgi:hypothetical protein
MKRINFFVFIISFAVTLVLWVLAFIFPHNRVWLWYWPVLLVSSVIYTIVNREEEYFWEMRFLGVAASLLTVLAVKWLFKL